MDKEILKLVKFKWICKSTLKRTKVTTNKSLGFASFYHCKSLKPSWSLGLYWKLYVSWTVLESANKNQTEYLTYNDINCWKTISSRFYFAVIFIFIFNAVITWKENICIIIGFHWSSTDLLTFQSDF